MRRLGFEGYQRDRENCPKKRDHFSGAASTYPYAKLNYLDSDQWYDMVAYDIPGTAKGDFDVVVDGGKDQASAKYASAVARIRTINSEVRDQNKAAKRLDNSDEFKVASVEKWLSIHEKSVTPAPMAERALSLGGVAWDRANVDDQKALGYFNRYCFRCHGSMYYSVFDKKSVLTRKASIQRRVRSGMMLQGRTLDQAERESFVSALDRVQ